MNMSRITLLCLLFSGLLVLGVAGGCGSTAPTVTPGPSETDVAATVGAALQATSTASAAMDATVQTAVAATSAVVQPASTLAPTEPPSLPVAVETALPTAAPTEALPTAMPVEVLPTQAPAATVDATSISEEELAAIVDAAVAEALVAAEEAAAATTSATADGSITDEETVTIEIAWADAEEAITWAEALIVTYGDVYGEYASEAVALLVAVEEDLAVLVETTTLMLDILEEGSEAATAAIEQINAALDVADAHLEAAQAQAERWLEALQTELENRSTAALAMPPNAVASNRQEAVQSAFQYVETVRASLSDSRVTQGELSAIAQAGANAGASLQAQGGALLSDVSGSIDALTAQIARGEWPQAQLNLSSLEAMLPSRP